MYMYIYIHVKEMDRKMGSMGGNNLGRDSASIVRYEARAASIPRLFRGSGAVDRVEGIGRSGVSIVGEGRVDRPDQWRRGWP